MPPPGPARPTVLVVIALSILLASAPRVSGAQPPDAPPPSPAPAAAPAPAPDDKLAEAKSLFRQGVALLDAGDVERALDFFLRSRAILSSGRNTTNAAICLQRLGRDDEALEMFEETYTKHLADLSEADRRTIEPAMRALRARVGTLTVSANVEGATLHVDGRARGRLPLTTPIRVTPGHRRVRVLRDGYEPFDVTVEVTSGASMAVDATLHVLARRGQLRIEDPSNEGSEVVVDGAVVGTSPWEGTFGPGRYVVSTQKGNVGAPPMGVVVLEGQVALVRVRSGPLGPVARFDAEPSTADIAVDGVFLAKGSWQGRLSRGRHELRVAEPGYVTAEDHLDIGEPESPPLRRVLSLRIDPTHPRWPHPPTGQFWIGAFGGFAFGSTLGSHAEFGCPRACDGDPTDQGSVVGARVGYRFPLGVSVEIEGGYLSLASAFSRTESTSFPTLRRDVTPQTYDLHPIEYQLSHQMSVRGPFVGGGVSYRHNLTPRLALSLRTGVGVVIMSATDRITRATASAGGQRLGVVVTGQNDSGAASDAPRSTPLFVWPELGVTTAFGPLRLGAAIGAAFLPLVGPSYPTRELHLLGSGTHDRGNPDAVSNAGVSTLDKERAFGPLLVWTPMIQAEYGF